MQPTPLTARALRYEAARLIRPGTDPEADAAVRQFQRDVRELGTVVTPDRSYSWDHASRDIYRHPTLRTARRDNGDSPRVYHLAFGGRGLRAGDTAVLAFAGGGEQE